MESCNASRDHTLSDSLYRIDVSSSPSASSASSSSSSAIESTSELMILRRPPCTRVFRALVELRFNLGLELVSNDSEEEQRVKECSERAEDDSATGGDGGGEGSSSSTHDSIASILAAQARSLDDVAAYMAVPKSAASVVMSLVSSAAAARVGRSRISLRCIRTRAASSESDLASVQLTSAPRVLAWSRVAATVACSQHVAHSWLLSSTGVPIACLLMRLCNFASTSARQGSSGVRDTTCVCSHSRSVVAVASTASTPGVRCSRSPLGMG